MGLGGPEGTHPHLKHANSIMFNAEKVYDDFLYDCHIVNQRLTEEDWLYYGREEHHIEVPNREGGLLTPLNSQFLTNYQHWVAGVLQSEVLKKKCYAFVPKETLPNWLEKLRKKWNADYNRSMSKTRNTSKRVGKPINHPYKKAIILTLPDGAEEFYDSLKRACQVYQLHPGHLREVCQGKRKQHKGFTARYAS